MVEGRWHVVLLVMMMVMLAGCKIQLVEKKNLSDEVIIEEIERPAPPPAPAPAAPSTVVEEQSTAPPSFVPLHQAPTPTGPPSAEPSTALLRPASTLPYQPPDIGAEGTADGHAPSRRPVSEVRVHMLDVGDAESVLVESDKTMLIDCGPEDFGKKTITYLRGQGIETIDILLLSNLERERIGACKDILYEFDVKRIIQNDLASDEAAYKEIKARAEELDLRLERIEHDTNITLDSNIDIELHVPYDKGKLSELKSHVVVVRLVHGDVSFLFTGDCSRGCERIFHENRSLDYAATVYGIGTHAEQKSATRLLFYNLSAKIGLLSANRSLDIAQADPETVKRYVDHGLRIYRTDYDGTIVVASDGEDVEISISRGIEHWKEGTKQETLFTPSPDCPFVAHYNSIFYYTFDCPLATTVEPQWRLCFADGSAANAAGRRLDSRCR